MGKSTAAAAFRRAGLPVFDADAAVHRLQARGGRAVPAIAAAFPGTVRDGAVDRALLRRAAVLDIPLLLETGGARRVDVVVVVSAPAAVQMARVRARRRMTPDQIRAIVARQMPDADKRRRAEDERSVEISLTAAGRALKRRATRVPQQMGEAMGLDAEGLEALRVVLRQLTGNVTRA